MIDQGAPVDLSPKYDNPALGADPYRNNNFTYSHGGFNVTTDQTHCPFSAHTRKLHPRDDFRFFDDPPLSNIAKIMRAGIPYGPEGKGP